MNYGKDVKSLILNLKMFTPANLVTESEFEIFGFHKDLE